MAKWVEKIKNNHGLMMIICCGVPLIIIFIAVYLFGLNKSYLYWLVFLLCPIMHYFMMRNMHKDHETDHETKRGKGDCH